MPLVGSCLLTLWACAAHEGAKRQRIAWSVRRPGDKRPGESARTAADWRPPKSPGYEKKADFANTTRHQIVTGYAITGRTGTRKWSTAVFIRNVDRWKEGVDFGTLKRGISGSVNAKRWRYNDWLEVMPRHATLRFDVALFLINRQNLIETPRRVTKLTFLQNDRSNHFLSTRSISRFRVTKKLNDHLTESHWSGQWLCGRWSRMRSQLSFQLRHGNGQEPREFCLPPSGRLRTQIARWIKPLIQGRVFQSPIRLIQD